MMTSLSPRQIDILNLARKDGCVSVDQLAAKFGVTPQTIRKDLNDLCESKHLERVHGGSMFPTATVNLEYHTRREIPSEGKRRIGETIARMIPNGASVIMNIGTTVEQVALALREHRELLVVTNNLNVALILQKCQGVAVVVTAAWCARLMAALLAPRRSTLSNCSR
mgnify:FL=1